MSLRLGDKIIAGVIPDTSAFATKTELNNKADTTLSNISANIDYVVESYQNGDSWYKVYKSGLVEQGGRGVNSSSGVSFLKKMADTNYSVSSIADNVNSYVRLMSRNVDNLVLRVGTSYSSSEYYIWQISGQGA